LLEGFAALDEKILDNFVVHHHSPVWLHCHRARRGGATKFYGNA